jgi:hypothetical protein
MGVYEARASLTKAMKELMARWSDTKGSWDDVISRNFEKKFLETLEADLKTAMSGLDHMAQVLQQVHRDCD